jgi:hypothetical protein
MEDSAHHIVNSKLTTEVSHNTIHDSVLNLGPQYISYHIENLTLMAGKEGLPPIQPSLESGKERNSQPQSQRYANRGTFNSVALNFGDFSNAAYITH